MLQATTAYTLMLIAMLVPPFSSVNQMLMQSFWVGPSTLHTLSRSLWVWVSGRSLLGDGSQLLTIEYHKRETMTHEAHR